MKFMQSLDTVTFKKLQKLAKARGIEVQEYIRAVVIGDFMETHFGHLSNKRSLAMKKGWETRKKNQEKAELAAKNEEFPPYPAGPTQ